MIALVPQGLSTDDQIQPALLTVQRVKLAMPPVAGSVVPRERLFAQLDVALAHPLTVVAGPAGSGKTTLVASWLQARNISAAWLSLDVAEADLRRFLAVLVAAVRRIVPGSGKRTAILQHLAEMPSPDVVAAILSDDLMDLPVRLVLVLDDFHLITSSQVTELLAALLRRPPPGLHVVLTTRGEAPALLRRLGAGRMLQIRDADLRFTGEETAAFLNAGEQPARSPGSITRLQEWTEGWAAALVLARLAGDDIARAMVTPLESTGIAGLLIDEVLAAQPEQAQALLLATSILDRVHPRLAAALVDGATEDQSVAILERLAREQVFVVHLDELGEWYRYHGLFREALVAELKRRSGPRAVGRLRAASAHWFDSEGMIEEAVDYALAAGAPELAAAIVARHAEATLVAGGAVRVSDWLRRLPLHVVAQQGSLLAWRAWSEFHRLDITAGIAATAELEQWLAARGPSLPRTERSALAAEIDAMRAFSATWLGDSATAIKRASRALETLPSDHQTARITATTCFAYGCHRRGDAETGLTTARAFLEQPGHPLLADTLLGLAEWNILYVGTRLHEAEAVARRTLRRAQDRHNRVAEAWMHFAIGAVRYEHDDLPEAIDHFSRSLQLCEYAGHVLDIDAAIGFSLALHASGDADAARHVTDEYLANLGRLGDTSWLATAESYVARQALMLGELDRAEWWLTQAGEVNRQAASVLERPRFTQSLVLLNRGNEASLRLAEEILRKERKTAAAEHMAQRGLRAAALLALVLAKLGEEDAAPLLRETVTAAAPAGYVRLFLDLGQPMARLLRSSTKSEYATGLIGRFEKSSHVSPPASEVTNLSPQAQHLALSLTTREVQVLRALAHEKSNKEIGSLLGVSPFTIKRHAASLYAKMGVSGRREAVLMAQQSGILTYEPD